MRVKIFICCRAAARVMHEGVECPFPLITELANMNFRLKSCDLVNYLSSYKEFQVLFASSVHKGSTTVGNRHAKPIGNHRTNPMGYINIPQIYHNGKNLHVNKS